MSALDWQPKAGDVIHYRRAGGSTLTTGRYRLEAAGRADFPSLLALVGITCADEGSATPRQLIELEAAGIVTPIDPAELERDRQVLEHKAKAPLRGRAMRPQLPQDDVDGLALFDAVRSPAML